MSTTSDALIAAIRREMGSESALANNGFQMHRTVEPLIDELETEIESIENPEE